MSQLAFVFPGQGSQSMGMLSEMAAQFPLVQETFAEATSHLGYDLWAVVEKGPEEKLNQTLYTQPALLVASVALWRVWKSLKGASPTFMAGHSLGEYSAWVCADAIELSDAVKLVAERARLMQAAVPEGEGAMAAILGLDNEKVIELCDQAAQEDVLTPANFNAIGQVVVAGKTAAVNRLLPLAKAAGAKALLIPVSVPSPIQRYPVNRHPNHQQTMLEKSLPLL